MRHIFSVGAILALLATPAAADLVTPGTWGPVIPGAWYDAQPSWDGPDKGITHLLADLPDLEVLSLEGAPSPFLFDQGTEFGGLKWEIADYRIYNSLDWLDLADPSIGGVLFFPEDEPSDVPSPGSPRDGSPSGQYFLNFHTVQGAYATNGPAYGQFALFRSGPDYCLGIEDLGPARTDNDYNDMVTCFRFAEQLTPTVTPRTDIPEDTPIDTPEEQPHPIPEPALLPLLALGLAAVRLRRRG